MQALSEGKEISERKQILSVKIQRNNKSTTNTADNKISEINFKTEGIIQSNKNIQVII